MVAVSTCGGAAVGVDGQGLRRATPDGVSGGGSDRCVHGMGHPQGSRGRRRVDQPDSAGGTLANLQLHSLRNARWVVSPKVKMGRQPRSGDFPWLSAHSILNWIGGDISMLDSSIQMSSILSFIFLWLAGGFSKRRSHLLALTVVLLKC